MYWRPWPPSGYGVWAESRLIASIGAVAVVVALLNPSRLLRQWLRRKFISKAPADVETRVEIPGVRPQPVPDLTQPAFLHVSAPDPGGAGRRRRAACGP